MRLLIITICIFMMTIIYTLLIHEANAATPPADPAGKYYPFKIGRANMSVERERKINALEYQCQPMDELLKNQSIFVRELWNDIVNDTEVNFSQINALFNQFTYIEEASGSDDWKTPDRFITDGGGDCEDFAIVKYHALKELGVSSEKMFVVAYISEKYPEGHAVLVIECLNTYIVLDSLTNEILNEIDENGYIQQYAVNEHGFFRYIPKKKALTQKQM